MYKYIFQQKVRAPEMYMSIHMNQSRAYRTQHTTMQMRTKVEKATKCIQAYHKILMYHYQT